MWYGMGFVVCDLVFADWGLLSGCDIESEGWVALAWALQGHSALQSIRLSGAWGRSFVVWCGVFGVLCVCVFASLLIGHCF